MKISPGQDALCGNLREILSAVEILSASRYRVDGRTGEPDDGVPLARALAEEIYDRLYSRQGDRPIPCLDDAVYSRHLAQLSAANSGHGTWEPGWRIRRLEDGGGVTAERRGVLYRVPPEILRCADGGAVVGDICRVRVPEESLRLAPGYYLARGDAEAAQKDGDVFVLRLYWHLRSEGAAAWVAALTAGLNRRRIPFRLKVLRDPRLYLRADAGVLYLEPESYDPARGEILRAWREVRAALRPEVPRLTARLAPGLGVAEGPADRSSFGEHRCALVADALTRAFDDENGGSRVEAVAAAFRAADLDPARPHLAPGSTIGYRPFDDGELSARERSRSAAAPAAMALGEAASRIGDVLCREAFRHNGRCTWVGRSQGGASVATLGADLYRGTAGVGLFLGELYAVTGEPSHRRTAIGALRQALAKLAASEARHRSLTFYDGRLGVAWAARRVAVLTGDAELAREAEKLLAGLAARPDEERRLDLLGGSAGAVLALTDLYRTADEARYLETALALGEEILGAAARRGPVWTWDNDRAMGLDPSAPPLAGLAHGAAGIGLALLALFAASGRQAFLDAATGAFAYEDGLFDRRRGNWPDLRRVGAEPREFMAAWCHGAPGIALSRLYAMAIDPQRADAYEAAARAGLETTRRALEEGLEQDDADTSLCHGLCGRIDVLLTGAEVLKERALDGAAREAARKLVALHGRRGRWPSGVSSRGKNPSLFLGEAGVGYSLLRLAEPGAIPSVLVPGSTWKGGGP